MQHSALVIGSGPNGLAAALVLAQSGWQVSVHETSHRVGGGAGSAELTLPGFRHDVGSAVHPLAVASPFFDSLNLGIPWIHPPVPVAHPLAGDDAVLLHQDLGETAAGLGADGAAWRELFQHTVDHWDVFRHELLAPLRPTRHLLPMARFGLHAIWSANALTRSKFQTARAKALFLGIAAHYPFLDQPLSAGVGLVLGAAAHAVGWPIPAGGAQTIAQALAARLQILGGSVHTGSPIEDLAGHKGLVLADTSPRALASIAGDAFTPRFRAALERYRYGCGAFKMDWALSEPIPWRAPVCRMAGTVHLGGFSEEITESEHAAVNGTHSPAPYVLLSQPTLFDPSRAPAGKHIAWAYCHVPGGSRFDMAARMEAQIERFAPGFRECVLARRVTNPAGLEQENANLVGGDVTGGIADLQQMFFRPTWRRYGTTNPRIYLCSSATPPGPGVHGMCGYHAARAALRRHG